MTKQREGAMNNIVNIKDIVNKKDKELLKKIDLDDPEKAFRILAPMLKDIFDYGTKEQIEQIKKTLDRAVNEMDQNKP